jgi:cytosine/adenosine deaminase-related metal-dependent hydrolase
VVLDTSGPHWHPRRPSWVETVIASATAADVRTVLVDGRVVVTGGAPVTAVDGAALDRASARIASAMGWR